MNKHNKIFKESFITNKVNNEFVISDETLQEKKNIISAWVDFIKSREIFKKNEEQLQADFTKLIFHDVLGYDNVLSNGTEWNYETERKTDVDGQKPDASFGYFTPENHKVTAIMELKDPNYRDLDKKQNRVGDKRTPIEQAFNYAPKYHGRTCKWVLVSNFNEIRLYDATNMTEYESFYIENMFEDAELKRFLYLLSKEHILESKLTSLIDLKIKEEERIEKNFYNKYKKIRYEVIEDIAKNNKEIAKSTIITKTQKLLDRFLFIAFCEDKNFIPANIFKNMTARDDDFLTKYDNFKSLCSFINNGNAKLGINKFNGGLFAPDYELDSLVVPDSIFEKLGVIADYDFNSDVDENILGHIFEQSLSDLEELKAEFSGENFDKKNSKRKKEGVFYTPKHITRKIVETSIREFLETKKVELGYYKLPILTEDTLETKRGLSAKTERHLEFYRELRNVIMNVKIIDPACGSGAFLITAFDVLKQEMEKVNEEIANLKGEIQELFDGDELYSSSYDNDILKNCLYGVDLNPESIEITRLSLWLRTLSKDNPLTNLDENIKCGNSLINDPEVAGELAFDWQKEFSEVFAKGGFDIVIGNPPYVRHEKLSAIKPALEKHFSTYTGTADLYCYFYELGIRILKTGGILGFITANKWLRIAYGKNIRKLINEYNILEIIDYNGIKIFVDAGVETNIIIVRKLEKQNEEVKITVFENNEEKIFVTNQNNFTEESFLFLDNRLLAIKDKIDKYGTPLSQWDISINYGIKTGLNDAFIIDEDKYKELIKADRKNKEILVPLLRGRDIKRYEIEYKGLYLINSHNGDKTRPAINIDDYPIIKEHLNTFEPQLSKRYDKGATPYNLRNCAYLDEFKKEKLIYGQIMNSPEFTIDNNRLYLNDNSFMVTGEKIKYILVLVNSKLIWTSFLKFYSGILLSSGIKLGKNSLVNIPIVKPTIDQEKYLTALADELLKAKENITAINKLLDLAKEDKNYAEQLKLTEALTEQQENILDFEYRIDRYVYSLYNLTQEEIQLIENS